MGEIRWSTNTVSIYVQRAEVVTVEDIVLQTSVFLNEKIIFSRNV